MFDARRISIFVGFDFHNVDALRIVNLNILIMVQGKKQLSSKPKFAEVVIGDNEAKEMRESDVDIKAELRPSR